jgi:phosphatidate cytidylyltransferase
LVFALGVLTKNREQSDSDRGLRFGDWKMGRISSTKIGTTFLIGPPVIVLIALGPSLVLFLLVFLATFLGLREFFQLAHPRARAAERWAGVGLGLFLSMALSFGNLECILPTFVLVLLFLSMLYMGLSENLPSTLSGLAITFFGIIYVAFLLSHIALIRKMPAGREWVLFLVVTVWAADIFALLGGVLFGRHKLYPKISPNKTVEGLLAGVGGSILVALVYSFFFLPNLNRGACLLLGIGLGVFSPLGDFTESMIKRSAQVKDSGALFPGHGGMLDRLDSFLFSAPFLHYSLFYLWKEVL